MPEYGFTINVTGNSVQEMKRIESELSRLGIQAKDTGKATAEALEPLSNKLSEIGTRIGEIFAIREIFNFGKEILNTTAEFEGFENRIKFASLNAFDASKNMAFLREEVERLHIPMKQAYEGFSEMEAGLVGTGIQGDRLRQLFDGLETAAATLHISAFNQGRMLLDFKEIGEIGLNRRIFRSLSTALPGLNSIIKEAFGGKGWDELEKEGLSGSTFLSKIGPALSKHFEGGLANFGNSLQAKMTDVSNNWTKTILAAGDKLRPVFTEILTTISGVLSSGPFQLILNNISGITTSLIRLGAVWIVYRGIMMSVTAVTKLYEFATAAMTVINYTAAFGVQGLTYSLEQMGISLAAVTTAIGVFSLAVIIEQFAELNHKIVESVENITHFKAMTMQFQDVSSRTEDAYTAAMLAKTPEDRNNAYGGAHEQAKAIADEIKKFTVHETQAQNRLNAIKAAGGTGGYTLETKELRAAINGYQKDIVDLNFQMRRMNMVMNVMAARGAKLPNTDGGALTGGESGKGLHGSHLSGAEGGLNQARIVNLTIGEVMHVVTSDNKNLVGHAEQAAQYIARALDNISESRSGTQ